MNLDPRFFHAPAPERAAQELADRTQELVKNPSGRTEALNRAMAQVVANPEFQQRFIEATRRGNQRLAHVEQVRRFRILPRDLCQEHGELTPTMKVKRKHIETSYAEELDRMYQEEGYALKVETA